MTLQIEVDPETEAQLTEQARDKGLDLPAYAGELLRAAMPPAMQAKPAPTIEWFRAMFDEFAKVGPQRTALR